VFSKDHRNSEIIRTNSFALKKVNPMHISKITLAVSATILGLITAAAIAREGFGGMAAPFDFLWTWQYFADLVVALGIVMAWIWHDCKQRGKQPLPWIIATFLTGSFAPLLYLIVREKPTQSTSNKR